MSLIPWRKANSPATRVTSLQSDLNRFFEDFLGEWPALPGTSGTEWAPPLSIDEDDKRITVKAEIPGMEPADININVQDNILTLKGEKRQEKKGRDGDTIRSELYYGSFMRQVALPSEVDADHAEATVKKGVLTLQLPKKPGARSKAIKVK